MKSSQQQRRHIDVLIADNADFQTVLEARQELWAIEDKEREAKRSEFKAAIDSMCHAHSFACV